MEEDLWWKATFDGSRPLTEDKVWQKATFDRRRPLTENNLWRKTTFDGRWPLTESALPRKTIFDKRRLLTEDNLWRKTTFDGPEPFECRLPFTKDVLQWKTTFFRLYSILPGYHVCVSSTWQVQHNWPKAQNRKSYQLSKQEIESHMIKNQCITQVHM